MSDQSSYSPLYRASIKDPAVVAEFDNLAGALKRAPIRTYTQATPTNPTGTASAAGVMMGLNNSITPMTTGAIFLQISGNLTNSTGAAGNGASAQLRYGTGNPPINGAALTGIAVGGLIAMILERATASDPYPFCIQAIIAGLTLGTAYWLDLALAATTAGTGVASSLSLTAFEL